MQGDVADHTATLVFKEALDRFGRVDTQSLNVVRLLPKSPLKAIKTKPRRGSWIKVGTPGSDESQS